MTGGVPQGGARRRRQATLALGVAVFALAVAVDLPVLRHGFFVVDDATYVGDNPAVAGGLTPDAARWAFTSVGHAGNWHPLSWLSHMLDVTLFGLDPRGHHLTSLVLHGANATLLFAALAATTGGLWRPALAAALFAVHPLHVESAAWVAERKDLLAALFWMLALLAHVAWARRPSTRRYLAVVLCLALGLLSKPMAVTLPIVLLVVDWWPLGRLRRPGAGPGGRGWAPLVVEKLPLLALAAVVGAITLVAQARGGAVVALADLPLASRLGNAAVAVRQYVATTLWPAGLTVFYPHPEQGGGAAPLLLSLLLIAAVSAAALRLRAGRPAVAAGWLWFLVALTPVLGLVQAGGQAAADRYTYLPKIGLLLAACWSIPGRRLAGPARAAAVALAATALLALSLAARKQLALWGDGAALARVAAAASPGSWQTQLLLADAATAAGRRAEAAAAYERALAILPVLPEAHQGLGRILLEEGDPAAAAGHFARAAQADPQSAKARFNLGVALAAQGRDGEAVAAFREAVRLDPALLPAWGNLALALAREGRREEALAAYAEALPRFPGSAELRLNAGLFHLEVGDAATAARLFGEALRIRPGYPEAAAGLEAASAAAGGRR